MSKRHIVIMAGGSGKRMGAGVPKQLLKVGNLPMLVHLFYLANRMQTDVVLVLSESNKGVILDQLIQDKYISSDSNVNASDAQHYSYKNIKIWIAIQEMANGTGGAVRTARDQVLLSREYGLNISIPNNILVLSADVPLISQRTVEKLFSSLEGECKCAIYAQRRENPSGYGRIITDTQNGRVRIVEQKDIDDPEIEAVNLINTGIYAFESYALFMGLDHINDKNAQGEYYLTDVPLIIQETSNNPVVSVYENTFDKEINYDEAAGANTPEQLAGIRSEYMKKFRIRNLVQDTMMTDVQLVEYMSCLSELTTVGLDSTDNPHNITMVREYLGKYSDNICKHIFVLEYDGRIVGTFSVLVEPKIIHAMSSVAHVEDVVILSEFRKLGLGRMLLDIVKNFCKGYKLPIYKIILECSDDVIGFYESNEFEKVGNSMRYDLH
jgi:bifunctional UDP-N-acetylglucosamine pyrophosphorylase / glucosamine-1-phosphate N-acetyltransferase